MLRAWVRAFVAPALCGGVTIVAILAGSAYAGDTPAPPTDDRSRCYRPAAAYADAVQACTRLIDAGSDVKNLADILLSRGNAHFGLGDMAGAIVDFTESINRRPDFAIAYQNRGMARMNAGELDDALADFNQAIRIDDKSANFYNLRAVLLTTIGEYDRAIADLDHAIAIDPNFANAYQNRGYALLHKRVKDKAIVDYSAAVRLAPRDSGGFVGRAIVLMDMASYDAAIRDLDAAAKLDPRNAMTVSMRGEARRLKGDLGGALADHNVAVGLAPDDANVHINRALVYRDKRDYDRALADLDEAILRNPKSDLAFADRGEIWQRKGDLDHSLADLDKAIALNPKSPVALSLRGDTLRLKGEFDRALDAYNAANYVVSDYVAAFTGRGLTLEAKGDLPGALAEFDRALKLPSDSDAEKAKPAQATARDHSQALRAQIEQITRRKDEDRKAGQKTASAQVEAQKAVDAAESKAREAESKAKAAEAKLNAAQAEVESAKNEAVKTDARAKALEAEIQAREAEAEARVSEAERRVKLLALNAEAAAAAPALPDQGRRVALVIGNSAYRTVPLLLNPRGDAEAVAAALKSTGFTTVILVEDATLPAMKKALRDFEPVADDADWALVYYAGHGIEIGGQNYIIPIDAHLLSDRDADDETLSLNYILDRIHGAHKLRLVILDACRENPFLGTMHRIVATRAVERGLAPYEPHVANEMVVFAAKDGEVAQDGESKGHSPFAAALLSRIAIPRIEINKLFRLVTSDVLQSTQNRQQPFVYGSTPGEDDFYFKTK